MACKAFCILLLFLGISAGAWAAETFSHAMLVADPKAPRDSMKRLETLLKTRGGQVISFSSNMAFIQVEWPTRGYTYAVLEYADPSVSQQIIHLFCYEPTTADAEALCEDIKERFHRL
jgi:hypothetical protein